MEKQGERASIFYYQAKVHLYSGQTLQKNRCGKIDAHVVLSFVFPTKTLLNKKLLNTVKYARAAERFGN